MAASSILKITSHEFVLPSLLITKETVPRRGFAVLTLVLSIADLLNATFDLGLKLS